MQHKGLNICFFISGRLGPFRNLRICFLHIVDLILTQIPLSLIMILSLIRILSLITLLVTPFCHFLNLLILRYLFSFVLFYSIHHILIVWLSQKKVKRNKIFFLNNKEMQVYIRYHIIKVIIFSDRFHIYYIEYKT